MSIRAERRYQLSQYLAWVLWSRRVGTGELYHHVPDSIRCNNCDQFESPNHPPTSRIDQQKNLKSKYHLGL